MSEINEVIQGEIGSADVVLFMKGTPVFPQCGFSSQVVQILSHVGIPFKGINVLEDDNLREGIKSFSNWPTIPQLYVKGEFVGGCNDGGLGGVLPLHEQGQLRPMLQKAGALAMDRV